MICEVRDKEVVLKHPTVSDILTLIRLMFRPEMEVVFTNPEEVEE